MAWLFKTLMFSILFVTAIRAQSLHPNELAHTYSIVARDSVTGELGVAVQTHAFGVGRRVPWAEAGIGVLATQFFTNPAGDKGAINRY